MMLYSSQTRGFYTHGIHPHIPADAVEITGVEYAALLDAQTQGATIASDDAGRPIANFRPPPTAEEINAEKIRAAERSISAYLDSEAQKLGYDNILTASSYAALPAGEPFQAEGAAFNTWRARCWAKAYAVLDDVMTGARQEPSIDEIIAELPLLEIP